MIIMQKKIPVNGLLGASATPASGTVLMKIGEMAGGMLIHDVHNHMFSKNHHHHHSNNKKHIRSDNDRPYHHHVDDADEDEDINGNEKMLTTQSHIRITENPLPPPPVNAAAEDYIR